MSTLVINDTPLKTGIGVNALDAIFKAHGEKYTLTHVVEHMADKDLKKIKADRWLQETPRLVKEAKKHQRVLCLGAIASSAWFGRDTTVPLSRYRGRGFEGNGKYTICTYQPKTFVADQDYFRDVCFDIEKLLTNEGPLPLPEIEIQMLTTKKDLRMLKDLHAASFLGCDIETNQLGDYGADILGIGFAALDENDDGYVLVIPDHLIGDEVLKFLTGYKGTLVFHNLMFDIRHLWRRFGMFEPHHLADTMLMNWTLDERPFGRYRSHGLNILQRLHFDLPEKSVSMKDWLEEYFRKDVGEKKRKEWHKTFCEEHPEMARTEWRKWYVENWGEEPEWRGRKVGRDIPIDDAELVEAVMHSRMPKEMRPAPDKARKAEMWEEMMRYMGEDCYSTARLFPLLKGKMHDESERLWNLHESYLIPASIALAQMRMTGTRIDVPYMEQMKAHLEEVIESEEAEIRKLVMEHTAHPKGEEFNPNSSDQVKQVLYDKEIGLGLKMPRGVGRYAYKRDENTLTTNSDTLKVLARQVAKDRPAIAKLINYILSYRVKSKILGTYVDGILTRLDPDGRIRGETNLHGTATARTSASNPNLQNIPDASHVGYDIRKAYVPSKGWTILEADYSQLELRVAALFSQDPLLLQAYREGADIHQEVAYMLWNKPKDQITKYERYLAKCMNFGVIYGRGARSIATGPEMDNLVEMSGRSWGNAEIDAYFAKFKIGYKALFDWMELVKQWGIKNQFIENPLGHRRRFDLITDKSRGHVERQIVNTPIQGFAGQMTIHALVQMNRRFDPRWQRILFTVHDSIMVEAKNSAVKKTARIIQDVMENDLPQDVVVSFPTLDHSPFQMGDRLDYNLPFVADVVAGPSWGECKDEAEHYVVRDPDAEYDDVLA